MWQTIQEGAAKISIPTEKKISKKLPVFYNPVMKLNRDMSVLLLKALGRKQMQITLPLAGTGVRGIRFLLELPKDMIKQIDMNDGSPEAAKHMKKNVEKNKAVKKKIHLCNNGANIFLLAQSGSDYIDIDPFGTPVPFLDAACKHLARNGILAVTATDTSALAGTYPNACKRKYWATPVRNELKHEIGLRILIRRVQLIAASYERALIPIFSYSKEHYMRVFFITKKGKKHVDEMLTKHHEWNSVGPLWTGALWDPKIVKKMHALEKENTLLTTIKQESQIPTIGFFDVHTIAKEQKWNTLPRLESVIEAIQKKGKKAARTHFCPTAIRTNIQKKQFLMMCKRK